MKCKLNLKFTISSSSHFLLQPRTVLYNIDLHVIINHNIAAARCLSSLCPTPEELKLNKRYSLVTSIHNFKKIGKIITDLLVYIYICSLANKQHSRSYQLSAVGRQSAGHISSRQVMSCLPQAWQLSLNGQKGYSTHFRLSSLSNIPKQITCLSHNVKCAGEHVHATSGSNCGRFSHNTHDNKLAGCLLLC